MTRWFRFYDEAMDDPKVLQLTDREFRLWVKLLVVASKNDGHIPPVDQLRLVLKARLDHLSDGLNRLVDVGLIDRLTAVQQPLNGGTTAVEGSLNDRKDEGYAPHNWAKRQYKSDTSTPRVQTFRAKRNVSETPPDTEADTETERVTPTALTPPTDLYAFQASNIRLTGKHLDQWRKAFPHITLESELLALDEWAGEQGKNWFHAVSSALAKRERTARDRINLRRTEMEAGPRRAAPDGRI